MRKSLLVSAAAASALAAAIIAPAVSGAAPTDITFVVAGGPLNITAPATEALDVVGDQATGSIAGVTVTDDRRGINGWTADAISTDFTQAAEDADIPASAVTYQGSLATVTGVAVVTPVLIPAPVLDTSRDVMVATAVIGANTATWNGNITIDLPSDVQAGTYSGTITHSVA